MKTLKRTIITNPYRALQLARSLSTIAAAALLGTGCMSTKYKSASQKTPAVTPLNLTTAGEFVQPTIHAVVVIGGPGSWKKEAYWDEYIVSIANHGTAPVAIESVLLTGIAATSVPPHDNPWALEKVSRTAAKRNFGIAKDTALQVGTGLSVVLGAGYIAGASVGTGAGFLGGLGAAMVATSAVVVAAPVVVGTSIYRNITGRHRIETEFNRRRLALPATLVPTQVVQGSLFLPITPGPKILSFKCRGESTHDVSIDLTPIAGLHLKALTSAAQ